MIGSKTRLVAIIGSPIAQVKSPDNFNAYFAAQKTDAAMIAIDLVPQHVPDFINTVRGWQNFDGFVVTIPHKNTVAQLVDELSPTAEFLGSANVVKRHADGRLSADMTDGVGFLGATQLHGFEPAGKSVLMVGAGAAGSAIGHALASAGVKELVIYDRNEGRDDKLVSRLKQAFPHVAISAEGLPIRAFDLVINASSSGMKADDPLPVPATILDVMPQGGLVADVVTSPKMTPLLNEAAQRNLRIQTGEEMAKAQLFALGKAMGVIAGEQSNV